MNDTESPILCEVCVDSLQGARDAWNGGAGRIELCGDLTTGGLTPSIGLIGQVAEESPVPVMVMIRPRGGDFCFSQSEVVTMCRDIEAVRQAGGAGVVLGSLRPNGELHLEQLQQLVTASDGMSRTLHRVFDVCHDAETACEQSIALGIDRILTSGQQPSVEEGLKTLARLQRRFGEQIEIMPGGGVRESNIQRVVRETQCREIHFSGAEMLASPLQFVRDGICFDQSGDPCPPRPITSRDRVGELRALAESAN